MLILTPIVRTLLATVLPWSGDKPHPAPQWKPLSGTDGPKRTTYGQSPGVIIAIIVPERSNGMWCELGACFLSHYGQFIHVQPVGKLVASSFIHCAQSQVPSAAVKWAAHFSLKPFLNRVSWPLWWGFFFSFSKPRENRKSTMRSKCDLSGLAAWWQRC